MEVDRSRCPLACPPCCRCGRCSCWGPPWQTWRVRQRPVWGRGPSLGSPFAFHLAMVEANNGNPISAGFLMAGAVLPWFKLGSVGTLARTGVLAEEVAAAEGVALEEGAFSKVVNFTERDLQKGFMKHG